MMTLSTIVVHNTSCPRYGQPQLAPKEGERRLLFAPLLDTSASHTRKRDSHAWNNTATKTLSSSSNKKEDFSSCVEHQEEEDDGTTAAASECSNPVADEEEEENDSCCCGSSSVPMDQVTVTTASSSFSHTDDDNDDDQESTASSSCSSLSCVEEEEDQVEDPTSAALRKKQMMMKRQSPSFSSFTSTSSVNSSSSTRAIFPDYWKAQGYRDGNCPFQLYPASHELLCRTSRESSSGFESRSCLQLPEEQPPVQSPSNRRSIFGDAKSQTPSPAPPSLKRTSSNHKAPSTPTMPSSFSSLLTEEQLQLYSPHSQPRLFQTTLSSPSLIQHPLPQGSDSLKFKGPVRKTQSSSILERPHAPRASSLRRILRYSPTTTTDSSTNDKSGDSRRDNAPTSKRPPLVVSFKEEVDVAVVPASSSVWIENWAADGWSDWFAA